MASKGPSSTLVKRLIPFLKTRTTLPVTLVREKFRETEHVKGVGCWKIFTVSRSVRWEGHTGPVNGRVDRRTLTESRRSWKFYRTTRSGIVERKGTLGKHLSSRRED